MAKNMSGSRSSSWKLIMWYTLPRAFIDGHVRIFHNCIEIHPRVHRVSVVLAVECQE